MTPTLEKAEKAVTQLSPEVLAQFRQWFAEYDGEIWDKQIEADAATGKLDALAQEALAEYYGGQVTEEEDIPEVFNLPPLTRKRLFATVRAARPAPFDHSADDYVSEDAK